MAIDFSFLEGAAPQKEEAPIKSDTANVTIRVDADSMLLCDGEYMAQQFKAGVITKIQLPTGQHLLEFLSEENPDVKVEKVVDFIEAGKSYLVVVNELKAALSKFQAETIISLGTKKIYRLVVVGYENQMGAVIVARMVLGWNLVESREKLSTLPAVLVESEDYARIEALANQFSHNNVNVSIETRNGLGELINSARLQTRKEIEEIGACVIPEGIDTIESSDDIIKYYNGELKIIFPSTLKRLGKLGINPFVEDSFLPNYENLVEIDLSRCINLEVIGNQAFSSCRKVKQIIIPNSITNIEIGWDAFSFCKSLEEIVIPENVKILGNGAFSYCKKLKKVHFENPIGITIENRAFNKCENLEYFNADTGVNYKGSEIFEGCNKLKIPESYRLSKYSI